MKEKEKRIYGFRLMPKSIKEFDAVIDWLDGNPSILGVHPDDGIRSMHVICTSKHKATNTLNMIRTMIPDISYERVKMGYMPLSDYKDIMADRKGELDDDGEGPVPGSIDHELQMWKDRALEAEKNLADALADRQEAENQKRIIEGAMSDLRKNIINIRDYYESRLREQTKEINGLNAQLRRMEQALHWKKC